MLRSRTVALILLVYVFLVVIFQISFLHSSEEDRTNIQPTHEVTSFRRSRFSRKRMQQIILAEDQVEMAVLKGQDGVNNSNLFTAGSSSSATGGSAAAGVTLASSSSSSSSSSVPSQKSPASSSSTEAAKPTTSPYLLDLIPDPNFKPGPNAEKLPASKVVCKKGAANCAIKNLYYYNKRFHAFSPGASKDKVINVNTGIGFGTPTISIYLHNEAPPAHFAKIRRVAETASIYSIMWENFMRTIYAGSGAWYTLMEHGLFNRKHRIFLNEPVRLKDFVFLLDGITDYPYEFLEDVENALFSTAVVGISRHFRIKEIELEYVPDDDMRKKAFLEFSSAVRNNMIKKSTSGPLDEQALMAKLSDPDRDLTITIIKRNGTRAIPNSDQMMAEISAQPKVVAKEYYFETLTFPEQVKLVFESDILIGMHGAAMAHVFFMRPGATLLEMFPFAFRKIVYQNLAPLVNALYFGWQNQLWANTKFNWNYVETHKLTNWTKEEIITKPLDWFNMDSKNYWRQQDTTVDIPNFMDAFRVIQYKDTNHYLLYLPSPDSPAFATLQLAIACSIGKQLKRRVVISPVGWMRHVEEKDEEGVLQGRDEIFWTALEEHFDQAERLPCDYITISNFNSLHLNQKLPSVYTHTSKQETQKQLFQTALYTESEAFLDLTPPLLISGEVTTDFADSGRFLAFADLDLELLGVDPSEMANLEVLPGFLDTIAAITTVPYLYRPYVESAVAKLGSSSLGIHLWLGPGAQASCQRYPQGNCLPTLDQVKTQASSLISRTSPSIVFVSTPLDPEDPQLADFVGFLKSMGLTVFLRADLLDVNSPRVLDLFEIEQLERQFLKNAGSFLGSHFSAYSQLVAFARKQAGKASTWI